MTLVSIFFALGLLCTLFLGGAFLILRFKSNKLSAVLQRQEKMISESKERFMRLSAATFEAVAITENGVIVDTNSQFCELLGYDTYEVIGMKATEFIAPRYLEVVQKNMAEKRQAPYEAMFQRKDKSTIWCELHGKNLSYADKNIRVTAIRDLTQRKELEGKLQLSDRLASIGQLAASVAHEINNPLTYVITNLELTIEKLKDGKIDEIRSLVQAAQEGANRVRGIARDLKTFSHSPENPQAQLIANVQNTLDASINMAFSEIRYRAKLIRKYQNVPQVKADASRLSQVFLNLLINAAQAITEGHVEENQILVKTRTDSDARVVIEIQDTGSGISENVIKRIFDPFFTTKAAGVGTGLGLSICKDIIQSYRGEIQVTSEIGKGTTFSIWLPPVEESQKAPEPVPLKTEELLSGKILIIDDEVAVAEALLQVLSRKHQVKYVTSGKSAIQTVSSLETFDLIISDVTLLDMTGMDIYNEIRRIRPGLEKRMIFLTGGAFTRKSQEFLATIPNLVVEKPISMSKLRAIVQDVLGKKAA